MKEPKPNQRHKPHAEHAHLQAFFLHKPLLFSIAYRMLGSVADAEDKVQETFLRWQQTSPQDIRSPRAFLVTILSRLCLRHLESARVRREEYVGQWLPEPLLTDNPHDPSVSPQMQESLSLAFLLLLEKLTPAERAAFLLHEVFDYEYSELSAMLGKSEANCRQLVRRARQHISDNRPRFDPSPEQHEKLLKGFLDATSTGNLDQLLALLSHEIVLYSDGGGKANAALNPLRGPDRVSRFLLGAIKKAVPPNVATHMTHLNGQPSIIYSPPDGRAGCVLSLDIADSRIQNIYIITNPEKLRHLARHSPEP